MYRHCGYPVVMYRKHTEIVEPVSFPAVEFCQTAEFLPSLEFGRTAYKRNFQRELHISVAVKAAFQLLVRYDHRVGTVCGQGMRNMLLCDRRGADEEQPFFVTSVKNPGYLGAQFEAVCQRGAIAALFLAQFAFTQLICVRPYEIIGSANIIIIVDINIHAARICTGYLLHSGQVQTTQMVYEKAMALSYV